MNKKIMVLTLLPAFSLFAAHNLMSENMDKIAKEREEWTKKHFSKQGSPVPGGGVTVLPEKEMAEYKTFKEQRAKERRDKKTLGYIKEFLPQVQSLLNFKEIAKNRLSHQFSGTSPSDEGLRHNISEIKMAYDFKGVPINYVDIMLGVAPSVTYVEGQGWAGAMQFFEKSSLGNCSYRENNIKISQGAAVIPKEDATDDVNGKITVKNITGEPNSGFMYSVDWYDDNYFRELKCANEKFNQYIMNQTIDLARIIDNNG